MHLLLLDDDHLNNVIISTVLQDLSIVKTVTVYNDGWDALQFLETNKEGNFPDVLFVDLKMPTMDGEEFVQKYEASFFSSFPGKRIVILSNSTLSRERDKIMTYECVLEYITKPPQLDKLEVLLGDLHNSSSHSF